MNGIGKITDTVSGSNYSDLTDGLEVECVQFLAVAELVAATDISRVTQEDIEMGLASVNSGQRTGVAAYWERKGLVRKAQWQLDLMTNLPRGMTDRGYGHRKYRAT